MSLRNQPYFPLFVQDFLTDEKLNECSAESVGVYIKVMCIMHKSDEYGTILLKQKDKHHENNALNFATKLVKHLPFPVDTILKGITELVAERVLTIDGDRMYQKRMVKDNSISEKRAEAGKKGGKRTQFAKAKYQANNETNVKANSEYEYEYDNKDDSSPGKESVREKPEKKTSTPADGKRTIANKPDRKLEFAHRAREVNVALGNLLPEIEISTFIDYWTEGKDNSVVLKWEKQDTWELDRRIRTWSKNVIEKAEKYGRNTISRPGTSNAGSDGQRKATSLAEYSAAGRAKTGQPLESEVTILDSEQFIEELQK
jgi:hypothetical protein